MLRRCCVDAAWTASTQHRSVTMSHVANSEAAFRHGRHSREVDPQILLWHLVLHGGGQQAHRLLHKFDRDPFPRTAVIGIVSPSALGNKVECTPIPVVEPFGPKRFRLLPYPLIMVGAIEIE